MVSLGWLEQIHLLHLDPGSGQHGSPLLRQFGGDHSNEGIFAWRRCILEPMVDDKSTLSEREVPSAAIKIKTKAKGSRAYRYSDLVIRATQARFSFGGRVDGGA